MVPLLLGSGLGEAGLAEGFPRQEEDRVVEQRQPARGRGSVSLQGGGAVLVCKGEGLVTTHCYSKLLIHIIYVQCELLLRKL